MLCCCHYGRDFQSATLWGPAYVTTTNGWGGHVGGPWLGPTTTNRGPTTSLHFPNLLKLFTLTAATDKAGRGRGTKTVKVTRCALGSSEHPPANIAIILREPVSDRLVAMASLPILRRCISRSPKGETPPTRRIREISRRSTTTVL